MDNFFQKYFFLSNAIKDAFNSEYLTDEEFFNLSSVKICQILKNDVNTLSLFLSCYYNEKNIYNNNGNNNNSAAMALHDAKKEKEVILLQHSYAQNEKYDEIEDISFNKSNDSTNHFVNKAGESSVHNNLRDDFNFVENKLYFLLNGHLEGRIILGYYKHKKILLDRRLKTFIIQKVITENPAHYKISSERFQQLAEEIKQLFPTVDQSDWYRPATSNAFGAVKSAGGYLINKYKRYRQDMIRAGIIKKFSAAPTVPDSGILKNEVVSS